MLIKLIQATAQRLMMIQHGIISQYIVIAGLRQLKAEFHIIIRYCHGLIKSAHLFILFPCHHQTCRRHAYHITGHPVPAIIIISVILEGHQFMGRPDPQIRDARMLNLSRTGIPQFRSHRPRVGLDRLPYHPSQPVLLYDLYIVIQK